MRRPLWHEVEIDKLITAYRRGQFDLNELYDKLVALGCSEEVADEMCQLERSNRED